MPRPPRPPMPPTPPVELPDRPLDAPTHPPGVAIRATGRHPFVYQKMVIGPSGPVRPADGDIVRVIDRDGIPLGFGLWNSRSRISLRILKQGIDPPGPEFWHGRLDDAIALRRGILKVEESTDAYRVVHAEGDGLSGLIVDRYAYVLSVEIFSLGMYQRIGPILGHLSERLGTTQYRVHVDERIALAEDFSGRPVASPRLPAKVTITEHGIRYRVHFATGHKTGFFCDQRENRRDLAKFCAGKSVLDLCTYTGGFALNALIRGGASEVTAVDLDESAVALAKENANLNQVRMGLVHADAFGYARQMAANDRRFGVVVLDPPKLIPGRLDIALGKRKYFDLNTLAMKLVEPGGLLLTCSCSGLLKAEEFLILLRAAARRAGRSVRLLAMTGASPDHPVGLDALEGSYLKAAWLLMGERLEEGDETEEESGEAEVPADDGSE